MDEELVPLALTPPHKRRRTSCCTCRARMLRKSSHYASLKCNGKGGLAPAFQSTARR